VDPTLESEARRPRGALLLPLELEGGVSVDKAEAGHEAAAPGAAAAEAAAAAAAAAGECAGPAPMEARRARTGAARAAAAFFDATAASEARANE
jgi:hypothetical protein